MPMPPKLISPEVVERVARAAELPPDVARAAVEEYERHLREQNRARMRRWKESKRGAMST
jgi:hypothetical protein